MGVVACFAYSLLFYLLSCNGDHSYCFPLAGRPWLSAGVFGKEIGDGREVDALPWALLLIEGCGSVCPSGWSGGWMVSPHLDLAWHPMALVMVSLTGFLSYALPACAVMPLTWCDGLQVMDVESTDRQTGGVMN